MTNQTSPIILELDHAQADYLISLLENKILDYNLYLEIHKNKPKTVLGDNVQVKKNHAKNILENFKY